MQKILLSITFCLIGCIPLITFTGRMNDKGSEAVRLNDLNQISIANAINCNKAAKAAAEAALREVNFPGYISYSRAKILTDSVDKECNYGYQGNISKDMGSIDSSINPPKDGG